MEKIISVERLKERIEKDRTLINEDMVNNPVFSRILETEFRIFVTMINEDQNYISINPDKLGETNVQLNFSEDGKVVTLQCFYKSKSIEPVSTSLLEAKIAIDDNLDLTLESKRGTEKGEYDNFNKLISSKMDLNYVRADYDKNGVLFTNHSFAAKRRNDDTFLVGKILSDAIDYCNPQFSYLGFPKVNKEIDGVAHTVVRDFEHRWLVRSKHLEINNGNRKLKDKKSIIGANFATSLLVTEEITKEQLNDFNFVKKQDLEWVVGVANSEGAQREPERYQKIVDELNTMNQKRYPDTVVETVSVGQGRTK